VASALAAALLVSSGPDAIFLDHRASVDLIRSPDLLAVEVSDETIIPLNASGVARFSSLSVPYDRSMETVMVVKAEIHPVRPGRPEAEARVTERPRPGLAASGRLESNFRELVIEFTGVETGDTLFITTRREIERLPLVDAYSYSFFSQSTDSIASSCFSVRWPAGAPLLIAGPPPSTDYEAGGVRHLQWPCGPMPALPPLPLGVPVEMEARRVIIASHPPEELGALLCPVLDPGGAGGAEEAALSMVIDSVGRDPDSLRAWVARSISFLGAGIGAHPGFTPRTPLQTLQDRCGVCRDKSVLLTALLREAGSRAWLGLTRVSHPLDELCGIRDFDHMVVLLERDGAIDILDPSTAGHSTPAGYALRGLPVLPVAPWCRGYETVPSEGCDTLSIRMSLGFSSGLDSLSGGFEAGFTGAVDELWRDMLSRVDVEAWPEMLEALFGASPSSALRIVGDPHDPLSAVSVEGTITIPSRLIGDGDTSAMILPGLVDVNRAGSRIAALLLAGEGSSGRAEGTDTPMIELLDAAICIPEGFAPSLPEPASAEGHEVSVRIEGDSLRWSESCDLGNHAVSRLRRTALARCAGSPRGILLTEER
jgi:hypothetical protein